MQRKVYIQGHNMTKTKDYTILDLIRTDEELKTCMVERDETKGMANKSGSPIDWQTFFNLY